MSQGFESQRPTMITSIAITSICFLFFAVVGFLADRGQRRG